MRIVEKDAVIAAGFMIEDFVRGVDKDLNIMYILRSEQSGMGGVHFYVIYEGGFYHYTGWQGYDKLNRYALSHWAIFDNQVYVKHSHECHSQIEWLSLHVNHKDEGPDSDLAFAKLLIQMVQTYEFEKHVLIGE